MTPPKKILVIDDERPTLEMFKLFLDAYGYAVLTAADGAEGLAVFERERPSLVLTDIKMPRMDGIEVLTRIKRLDPLTEVIVITGHGDMDLAIKALNLDATDFINKPVGKEALDKALARAAQRLELVAAGQDEVQVDRVANCVTVDIRGNITTRSEVHLTRAFQQAGAHGGPLLLRFDDATSINGAGLTILAQLLESRHKDGLPVGMVGLSENFRQVFETLGLSASAPVFADETEATERLCES